ncbi:hypothetical protein V6N12_074749 [Hibiscus sabdariffa]|uniref:Uncharacterized protein n=1 Tax=Hibiscus sabdariffa TaxID=183260 RepID=A0ABR2D2C2_9ROSI
MKTTLRYAESVITQDAVRCCHSTVANMDPKHLQTHKNYEFQPTNHLKLMINQTVKNHNSFLTKLEPLQARNDGAQPSKWVHDAHGGLIEGLFPRVAKPWVWHLWLPFLDGARLGYAVPGGCLAPAQRHLLDAGILGFGHGGFLGRCPSPEFSAQLSPEAILNSIPRHPFTCSFDFLSCFNISGSSVFFSLMAGALAMALQGDACPHSRRWGTFLVPEILERIPMFKPNSGDWTIRCQGCGSNRGSGSSSGFDPDCCLNGLWESTSFSRPDLDWVLDLFSSWVDLFLFLLGHALNPIRPFRRASLKGPANIILTWTRTLFGQVGFRTNLLSRGGPYCMSGRVPATSWSWTVPSHWATQAYSLFGRQPWGLFATWATLFTDRAWLAWLFSYIFSEDQSPAAWFICIPRPWPIPLSTRITWVPMHVTFSFYFLFLTLMFFLLFCSSSQTSHILHIPNYLRTLLFNIEHMLTLSISLRPETFLSTSFCCVMDPELMSALENLQFTEEEATVVVAESPMED